MSDTLGALAGKRVVLGVCGGIAAYKAIEVCRRLSDAGALVSPVLTAAATRFIAPLTFSALADEAARVSLWPGTGEAPAGGTDAHEPVPHISLARRADAVVVAPATARLLGAYAYGLSSDLLSALLLATTAPVMVCPAMHTEMWEHPAVRDNVAVLARRGVHIVGPEEGRLAGGDYGAGRLSSPEHIVSALATFLASGARASGAGSLAGVRAVVSAGGTREPIDAVRYISNASSGKQGYAVAETLAARGATVTLVTASERPVPQGVRAVAVQTAAEMADAVLSAAEDAQVVVMVAAVADYRPEESRAEKLKKTGDDLVLRLVPTLDILSELGSRRRAGQLLVGFAAETASGADLVERARAKLEAKRVDLVVANDVSAPGAGFGSDRNSAVIVSAESAIDLGLADKKVVAAKVVDSIEQLWQTRRPPDQQA